MYHINEAMFPRFNKTTRLIFYFFVLILGIFCTLSIISSIWYFIFREIINLQSMNSSQLLSEFMNLKKVLNISDPLSLNYSRHEIEQRILWMRSQIPTNPHPFLFTINPSSVCSSKNIYILIYVHSDPSHLKRRLVIRRTWGNQNAIDKKTIFRVVFLTGIKNDNDTQQRLLRESEIYGDIIQENFIDSYRNLTLKAVMGLKWVKKYCTQAKYILKTDDDIFVNIKNLVVHLRSLETHSEHKKPQSHGVSKHLNNIIICLVWNNMKVVRDQRSKWYIPKSEYRNDHFPTYCSGSAFVMSGDIISNLYNISLRTPFFWVDDLYVSGMLASKAGVRYLDLRSLYALDPSKFVQSFTDPNKGRTLVFGHVHSLNQILTVWRYLNKP